MEHVSVLLQEVITHLDIDPDGTYVDGTLGAAGHSMAIAERLSNRGTLVSFDLDPVSIAHAQQVLGTMPPHIHLVQGNFKDIASALGERGIGSVRGILLDLGWNSDQFADPQRGFSFQHDGPLDMTFAQHKGGQDETTAWDIVNEWQESSIIDILYGYADEQYARRIAKGIVLAREEKPIDTTAELVAIIKASVPTGYLHKRIHPATKTFQALRIAVNDEIISLQSALPDMFDLLESGGRLLVITFHSIEDRIVKNFMRTKEKEGKALRIEKRGITPSSDELKTNPRSRSARLRILQKL